MNNTLIGLIGFAGSGKDTVADYLCSHHAFTRNSFAASLKDVLASIFGWDREMLEGVTPASRQWRETIDEWWATRLNIPNLSPRTMMQYIGTDLFREKFNDEIWVASLERKLLQSSGNVVITDCRFPNEISTIQQLGGKIVLILRHPYPEWYPDWYHPAMFLDTIPPHAMPVFVHPSEYSWIGSPIHHIVYNNGTIDDLHNRVSYVIEHLEPNHPASR